MVVKRKWAPKRKTTTRSVRRRTVYRRRRTYSSPGVHSFKRMITNTFSTIVLATTTNPAGVIYGNAAHAPFVGCFNLSGVGALTNSTELTNLYDQFRINKVVTKIQFKIDPGAQAANVASYPRFYYYRDYDDSNAPANLAEMRENSKTKMLIMHPNRYITLVCKPNMLQNMYASAITNTYKPTFGNWVDCASPNAAHYLWKYAIDDLLNTNYRIEIETTLYVSFRQSR